MIEAFWRSMKHQWLFLNTLDSVARGRALVDFYVNEHNTAPGSRVAKNNARAARPDQWKSAKLHSEDSVLAASHGSV